MSLQGLLIAKSFWFIGESMSSDKSFRSQDMHCFIRDWMSSDKSSWLQNVCWSIRDSMFVDRGDNALSETEWVLIRAPDRKKFASQSEIQCLSIGVTMSSNKSSWSQGVCWSMRESMSSHKSSWSQEVFAGSGSQWALIRASDCKKFFGQSESQWRAPDRKKVNEIQNYHAISWMS